MADSNEAVADIGVFGGSGFYSLLENVREVTIETPYGASERQLFLAEVSGKRVAFLPRHGEASYHSAALYQLSRQCLGDEKTGRPLSHQPCAAGSLQKHVEPEHFVVCDQYVDRTRQRKDTFYDGPEVFMSAARNPTARTCGNWPSR